MFSKNLTCSLLDNKFWTSSECKSEIPFFAFSATVYLANKAILVIGGFNDEVEGRKTFSSRVLKITEKKVNIFPIINVNHFNRSTFWKAGTKRMKCNP